MRKYCVVELYDRETKCTLRCRDVKRESLNAVND